MGLWKWVAGAACLAAASVSAQTPAPAAGQHTGDPVTTQPARQPGRQGVAPPMNMRIRGDGLALPQGVGRDADAQREEQREEQREAKPAAEEPKKPER